MYPHRIRLRGPWELTAAELTPRRVLFPATYADIGLPDFVGRVAFVRRFGYPGRIDAHERVWLVGEGVATGAEIDFQDEPLGVVADRFAFEVTPRLRERNVLKVALDIVAGQSQLWDDIALEIRATAYLEKVIWEGGTVRGQIAGTCEAPLDVYVLAANRTCGYSKASAGEEFAIACPNIEGPVRVELVNAATVWHVMELPPDSSPA